jgi:hypothetical protein
MFSTLMFEHHKTKTAIFGGKPNEEMEYKGVQSSSQSDGIFFLALILKHRRAIIRHVWKPGLGMV